MLTHILANAGPAIEKAQGEGSWITTGMVVALFAGLAAVIAAYNKGKQSTMSIDNDPLHVKKADDYVTQEEFDKLEGEVKEGFAEIRQRLEEERGIARNANGAIHKRIDTTQAMVSEIKGKLEGMEKLLNTIHDHILNKPKTGR
jgi:hypothetical protein